jgi:amidohydrolase
MFVPWIVGLAALAPVPGAHDAEIAAAVQEIAPALSEVRRDLHAYPELANREFRTGKIVAARLRALGLEVRHPVAKTGVVGILRGAWPGRTVAVRADMDALPIEERRDVPYRSRNPGVMHACGYDAHTARTRRSPWAWRRFCRVCGSAWRGRSCSSSSRPRRARLRVRRAALR